MTSAALYWTAWSSPSNTKPARQGIEYHAQNTSSLWHYFKTVEFWREDLLQTPVLVLDQFEEIFTLQNPHGSR